MSGSEHPWLQRFLRWRRHVAWANGGAALILVSALTAAAPHATPMPWVMYAIAAMLLGIALSDILEAHDWAPHVAQMATAGSLAIGVGALVCLLLL